MLFRRKDLYWISLFLFFFQNLLPSLFDLTSLHCHHSHRLHHAKEFHREQPHLPFDPLPNSSFSKTLIFVSKSLIFTLLPRTTMLLHHHTRRLRHAQSLIIVAAITITITVVIEIEPCRLIKVPEPLRRMLKFSDSP